MIPKLEAEAIYTALDKYIEEFEASFTSPNIVLLNQNKLNLLKQFYPTLFNKDKEIIYKNFKLRVEIVESELFGVSWSFYTDAVIDYHLIDQDIYTVQ